MADYTLSPETLARINAELRKQVRITAGALIGVGLVLLAALLIFTDVTPLAALIAAVVYLAFIPAAGWYFYKVQSERWQLYRITLSEDTITREEGGRSTQSIHRDEITAMYDIPEGGILIKTERRRKYIHITPELDDFDAIRAGLQGWRAFDSLEER